MAMAVKTGDDTEGILLQYSQGQLGRKEAMDALGVDYGTLLQWLALRSLPIPRLTDSEVRPMVKTIVEVFGKP